MPVARINQSTAMIRLAQLAERVSIICVENPKPYHIKVQLSVRLLRQIREALTDAGIDWRAQRRQYVKELKKLQADADRKAAIDASVRS